MRLLSTSTMLLILASLLSTAVRASDAPAAAPTATAAAAADVIAVVVDEGVLLAAVSGLLDRSDVGRVAIVVDDSDARRQQSIERSLVRVVRDRRREDVVTPALARARLGAAAKAQLEGRGGAVVAFAADHVLLADVFSEGGRPSLRLRLLVSATAAVVGTATVAVTGTTTASTAHVQDMAAAAADIADIVAEAVESTGAEVRTQRIAVPLVKATGAALEARLDRYLASTLTGALRNRGFLVVERTQISAAMDQLALDQNLGTNDAGPLGKMLGAQSLLLASVVEAGTTFVVNARVVGVETGSVLGAAQATIRRDNVVSLAAVETRTAGEAAVLSLIAPGLGQNYNGDNGKAVLFAVGAYGSLLTTVGLGVASGLSFTAYRDLAPDDKTSAAEVSKQAVALRQQTNTLLAATAIAGGVTVAVWALNVIDALASGD